MNDKLICEILNEKRSAESKIKEILEELEKTGLEIGYISVNKGDDGKIKKVLVTLELE